MLNCELEFLLHHNILPVSLGSASFTAKIEDFPVFFIFFIIIIFFMNGLEKPNEMLLSKDGFQCCMNS